MNAKRKKELQIAVLKSACGFTAEESEEEYAVRAGEWALVRRKVKTKVYPPDMTAARLLWTGEARTKPKTNVEDLLRLREKLKKEWEEKYADGTDKDGR